MRRSIEATTQIRASIERAREILINEPGSVLSGGPSTPDERSERRFLAVLSVGAGAGASLQQEVVVETQPGQGSDMGLALPIRWHATGRERLFPRFDGELVLEGDAFGSQLTLRGSYTVPLGPLGGFGDGLAGRRLARHSVSDFLRAVARRLDAEVDRRQESVPWHLAPYSVALREPSHR